MSKVYEVVTATSSTKMFLSINKRLKMCGSCKPIQKAVPWNSFLFHTSSLISDRQAGRIYDAVTALDKGAHLGEATFLSTLAVAIGYYQTGNRNFLDGKGFMLPLSAHDTRLDSTGVPIARYETTEMRILLESFRRVWMSDTVRTSLVATLAEDGLAIPTFACSGLAIVPVAEYQASLDWYRDSGWQMRRAQVDQGDRTYGPEDGYFSLGKLPETVDLTPGQVSAITTIHGIASNMAGDRVLGMVA